MPAGEIARHRTPERGKYTVSCAAPVQRAPVRLWNRLTRAVAGEDVGMTGLSVTALHEHAVRHTGLDDFGPDTYLDPMRRLVESLCTSARLHPFGRFFARQTMLQCLENRLYIQREWKQRPEASDVPVTSPVFVIGLPRTGTTHLLTLLAQDRQHRFLTNWEAIRPVPPPGRLRRAPSVRRIRSIVGLSVLKYLAPAYNVIYPLRVEGPEECGPLVMNEFTFPRFQDMFRVPEYTQWIRTYDYGPAMAYHRRQLQLLQVQRPTHRWLLKSPYLISALSALLSTYPDACVIQTHRDPINVVPSECSLWSAFRAVSSADLDAKEIGDEALETLSAELRRCEHDRNQCDPARIFDVDYERLSADPIGTVREIYGHFGFELTDDTEVRMRNYLESSPKHVRGVHRYSLSQFGLDERRVRDAFAWYYERFAIQEEASWTP